MSDGTPLPLAIGDGYRPRVVCAGSGINTLPRRRHRNPGGPHATYLITCWHAPGVLVGTVGKLEPQPQEGIWLTPPGERVLFNAPKGAELGWIHCRPIIDRAWEGKTGQDFRLTTPGNEALVQPSPQAIWGVDLCHGPPPGMMQSASRACFRIIAAWNDLDPAGTIDADGELAMLFHRWYLELKRNAGETELGGAQTNAISVSDTAIIRRCNRILADGNRMDLTVEGIAEEVGVKRDVLTRIYQGRRGQGLGWYLRERRLRQARQLLADRRMTVEEVARHCGYASATVLRRALKQRYGRRPRDFRR